MSPRSTTGADPSTRKANYHSPLRQRQAAATRQAVLGAAVKLFSTRGWTATTLPMVAAEAGTAVDVIYSAFGSKSGLLLAAVDLAIAGDDSPVAMVDRPELQEFGIGSTVERLRTGIRFTLDVYERSVPILRALREAAASDESARDRLEKYDNDRRAVIIVGLAVILDRPAPDELVDAFWTLVSPEVVTMLRENRGWSRDSAEEWLLQLSLAAISHCSKLS